MHSPSPFTTNLQDSLRNVKLPGILENLAMASPLARVGIGNGGLPNNTSDQGAYTGSGPSGAGVRCHSLASGGSIIDSPREAVSVDVGHGAAGPALDPLKAAWGDFIDQVGKDLNGWDWFATLTFRDPDNARYPGWTKPGWKYAHRALRDLMDQLMTKRLAETTPYSLACMEYQHDRGVPHWHVLVGNTGVGTPTEERRMDWVDWWWSHYGIARVLAYDEKLGARYYLGKYLTKELADVVTSPQLTLRHRQRWQANQANAAWLAAMTSE